MKLFVRCLSLFAMVLVFSVTLTSCDALLPDLPTGCFVHEEKRIVEKEATCTESGIARFECVHCGEVLRTQDITPSHKYGDVVYLENPTCQSEGLGERSCTVCDHTLSGPLPKAPHNPNNQDVCIECNELISAEELYNGRYDDSAGELTMFSVYLARGERSVKIGETVRMSWSGYPYVSSSRVYFRSTDTKVATVDSYGEIKGVGYGTCCIIATVPGTTLAGHISVAVSEDGSYDALGYPFTVSPQMAYLPAGTPAKIEITLAYEFYPESITVTTSDPSCVSISYGERRGLTQEVTITPLGSANVLVTVHVGSYSYDVGYWSFG